MKNKLKFKSFLQVTPYVGKDTEFFPEYFKNRCNTFYLFTYGNNIQLDIYKKGINITRILKHDVSENKIIKIIQLVAYFVYASIFLVESKTIIFIHHPYFFMGSKVIKTIKKHTYIFRIGDYYPCNTGLMRIYHFLVEKYNRDIDNVFYISPFIKSHYIKLIKKRKVILDNILPNGIKIDLKEERLLEKTYILERNKKKHIGYIGILRPLQGTEELLASIVEIDDIVLDIIGTGEYLPILQKLSVELGITHKVNFYGFVDYKELLTISSKWYAGLAPYKKTKENMTLYTEPSKIKTYISLGVPVIMTDVSHLYPIVLEEKAGIVITDSDSSVIKDAIENIIKNNKEYLKGIMKMSERYNYIDLYDKYFKEFAINEG